ncbi:MAG: hypothetical protein Q8R18_03780 [bacterium]|nr:hypothetical protein [bacterium]
MQSYIEIRESIGDLKEYFTFPDAPGALIQRRPELAQRAINLLDKIQEISNQEYVFLHVQSGPFGGICAPRPKNYNPNSVTNTILGSYDRQYFVNFIEKHVVQ